MNLSATEFMRYLGKYLDLAIEKPIIVERHGRPVVVVLSYNKYLEFQKLLKDKK